MCSQSSDLQAVGGDLAGVNLHGLINFIRAITVGGVFISILYSTPG